MKKYLKPLTASSAFIGLVVGLSAIVYLALASSYGQTSTVAFSPSWMPSSNMIEIEKASPPDPFHDNTAFVWMSQRDFQRTFAQGTVYFSLKNPGEVTYYGKAGKIVGMFKERSDIGLLAPSGTKIIKIDMTRHGVLVATLSPMSKTETWSAVIGLGCCAGVLATLSIIVSGCLIGIGVECWHEVRARPQLAIAGV